MNLVIHPTFLKLKDDIGFLFKNFNSTGEIFIKGKRNTIKLFKLEDKTINIKSFKEPNFINKIVYQYFRNSKAKRSFEFANRLLENGIGTPQPIAYFENFSWLGLQDSYYVSEHLASELTFRELVQLPEYPENELILRQFTQFCYLLHEKGIEFKDHSPGNTLIKKDSNGIYSFYLVDLNRMEFHQTMSFELRMKNLCRLTPKKEMIEIMANEYANCSGENEAVVFSALWKYTTEFQQKFHRKRALKQKYLGK
jgi:hypothetical protein